MLFNYSLFYTMRKKKKNSIDTVNAESVSRNELKQTNHNLNDELDALQITINEPKLLIEDPMSFTKEVQDELPSEIQILKEIIISQREDLSSQDNKIDQLNEKLDELKVESSDSQGKKSQEIIYDQSLGVQITNENEELKEKINNLQSQLEKFQSNKSKSDWDLDEEVQIEDNAHLVNLKQLNFQLMEENGLLRVEVESLKNGLQSGIGLASSKELELESANNKIEVIKTEIESLKTELENGIGSVRLKELELELANNKIEDLKAEIESLKTELESGIGLESSEELELATNKIEALKAEVDDYQAQVKYLQEINEGERYTQQTTEENIDEFNKLKNEVVEYQKQNLVLNDMLIDLKEDDEDRESDEEIYISEAYTIPKKIALSLFNRIYNLLNTQQKRIVKNILILDLTSDYLEVKRDTIKMLSQIKDIEIYNAFIDMIHDKDWIIRLYIIKALSTFENKQEELKILMKELSTDVDVDVRELAVKVLYNITHN